MDMRCCCSSYQVDTQNKSNTSDGTLKEIQKWSQIESASTDKPKLREQVSTPEERNCYFLCMCYKLERISLEKLAKVWKCHYNKKFQMLLTERRIRPYSFQDEHNIKNFNKEMLCQCILALLSAWTHTLHPNPEIIYFQVYNSKL